MTRDSERVATQQSVSHLKTTRCVNGGALEIEKEDVDGESGLRGEEEGRTKLLRRQKLAIDLREQHCWPHLKTSDSSRNKFKYLYELAATLRISSACFNWHKANLKQQFTSSCWLTPKQVVSNIRYLFMSHFILLSILLLHLTTSHSKLHIAEAAKYRQNFPPSIGYNDAIPPPPTTMTRTTTNFTLEEATKGQPIALTTFHHPHLHHHHHHPRQQQQQNHQEQQENDCSNKTSPKRKTSIEGSRFQREQQLLPETDLNVSTLADSLSNIKGQSQETSKEELVRKKENWRRKRNTNGVGVGAGGGSNQVSKEPQLKRQVIHAMLKGQVQLNCNIQPSEPDDAVSLVLWYKDKSTVPIYSLDARSSTIKEARHKPGPWLEGRSSLKVFTKRSVIRNKRQLEGAESRLNLSPLNEETTFLHSGNPTLSSPLLLSQPQAQAQLKKTTTTTTTAAATTKHEMRKRHRRHRNHIEQRAIEDEEFDAKLAKFASVWSAIIHSGPNLASKRLDDKADRGLEKTPSSSSSLSSDFSNTDTAIDTDSDQVQKPVLLQRKLHELPALRPLSKHQFTFQASQPDSTSSRALIASSSRETDGEVSEQQLIASLQIDSLSSEDNGVYLCRVDFRKARSRTQESILKIIVPPDKPIIRDLTNLPRTHLASDDSLLRSGQRSHAQQASNAATDTLTSSSSSSNNSNNNIQIVGPHNENSRIVLECETQGGYPEPVLSWWRDGRLIDDSYEIISSSDGLVIAKHSVSDKDGLIKLPHLNSSGEEDGGGSSSNEAALDQQSPIESSINNNNNNNSRSSPSNNEQGNINETSNDNTNDETKAVVNKQVTQNRLIRNRLEISGLTRADLLANYSCQAWNTKLSEPPTSSIMIDMNLRPIKVQIENDRLPVLADKPLEIVCRAFGSRPAALISWFKGNTKLIPKKTMLEQNSPGRSAIMAPLGESNQETTLLHGNNQNQLIQVQLIEELVSSDSNITTSTLTFVPQIDDGGSIITCRAENPFIQSNNHHHHHYNNNNNLKTTTQTADLELLGTNSFLLQNMMTNLIEDSWKLDVHYLPKVKLAFGEKLNSQIQEGHDVYFECSIKAHPNAHEVRWWFNGKELESNTSNRVIISNQSLVLQKVNRNQRGRYTCSAINSVGESHSNSVHLRVQYAPFCRDTPQDNQYGINTLNTKSPNLNQNTNTDAFMSAVNQQRFKTLYGAARLESVKVYCHIDADPADSISYKWAFVSSGTANGNGNGITKTNNNQQVASTTIASKPEFSGQQLVYLDSSLIANSDGDSNLVSVATYTPRSELDYGTLLCWGQNNLGQQSEPCVYQIVPAERPDPVRNCRLLNASDTQLTVACEPGYDGGIDQSFQMEVYDTTKHELVANVSSNSANLLAIPLLSSANKPTLLSSTSNDEFNKTGSNTSFDESNFDTDNNHLSSDSPDFPTNTNTNQRGKGTGNEPASLVGNEPIVSRQQKQRHSLQISSSMASSNGLKIGSKLTQQQQQQQRERERDREQPQIVPLETVFITDPILRPATDYFLSIYSSNSKGSSKPVAFTATTMNLSTLSDPILSSSPSLNGNARDGRRADASHLFNDVLALSWSPFLLICTITVALFVIFASITFAMMKYVDFSSAMSPQQIHHRHHRRNHNQHGDDGNQSGSNNGNSSPYGLAARSCLSSSNSGATTTTAAAVENLRINGRAAAATTTGDKNCNNNGNAFSKHGTSSEFDDEDDSISLQTTDTKQQQQQRKRVVTVATAANKNTSTTDKERGSSFLNGSYLKFKFSQLTGGSPSKLQQSCKLKQSTSDNYLNQMGLSQTVGIQLDGVAGGTLGSFQQRQPYHHDHHQQQLHHQQLQNQHQQLLLQHHQVSGALCGTLPRNFSQSTVWRPFQATTNFYQAAPGLEMGTGIGVGVDQPSVAAFTNGDNHQGLISQLNLQQHNNQVKEQQQHGVVLPLENPYGVKSNTSITGSTTSPDAYATTTTYSASGTTGTMSCASQPTTATTTTHQSLALFGPTSTTTTLPNEQGNNYTNNCADNKYSSQYQANDVSNSGLPVAPTLQAQTGYPGLLDDEVGRVEQLVISGKQYIHQTSVNRALYPASRSQQQQQQQQQRHLQMTSGSFAANAGSTSAALTAAVGASNKQQHRNNQLYTTSGGSLQSMMKDYLSQQQQQQQQNYLQNQQALVCINHAMAQNQTGFQTKQRLTNGDQIIANNELASVASHDLNAQAVDFQPIQMHFHHAQNLHQHQHHHHNHNREQHQQAGKTHMTGENYSSSNRMAVAASAAASLNNALVNVKTSDLGDELPVANECENNIHALCHVAHLTLIDGCDNVATAASANAVGLNLDSDGMSSETQRSFTTNGSPSSGIGAEMEHSATTCQQHNRIVGGGQPIQIQATLTSTNHHHLNNATSATSTITSNELQQLKQEQFDTSKVGGNVIGVNKEQTLPVSNSDEVQTMHSLKPNQKVNSFKNGRKIFEANQEFVQTTNRLDPQLEQYTMYVDENCQSDKIIYKNSDNNNNNIGEFYVLPVDDNDTISGDGYPAHKARLRLVGATNGIVNYRQNEINLLTTNNYNSSNNTADQTNKNNDLQTDV